MKQLTFALVGTGFWANYQLPGWQELEGVSCVAAYNRTKSRAQALAEKFGVARVYDDLVELLDKETSLDFIDICTDVDTHLPFTTMAAERGLNVVCQKPMAASLEDAQALLAVCQANGVKLFINENFRWQAPIRRVKEVIASGMIGDVFKANIRFCSAFPVFDNQPFLAELDHFILTDVGSHVLDITRFLCGEAKTLHCLTQRVNPNIKGEDVANCFIETKTGIHCYVEMSYASLLEREAFPQTLLRLEGTKGSVTLEHDFVLKVTTKVGTTSEIIKPIMYDWLDPDYAVVHSSIVDAQRNILNGLRGSPAGDSPAGEAVAETTGEDNLKTVELVWKAYESAATGHIITME